MSDYESAALPTELRRLSTTYGLSVTNLLPQTPKSGDFPVLCVSRSCLPYDPLLEFRPCGVKQPHCNLCRLRESLDVAGASDRHIRVSKNLLDVNVLNAERMEIRCQPPPERMEPAP